jgi:hypothetical protein
VVLPFGRVRLDAGRLIMVPVLALDLAAGLPERPGRAGPWRLVNGCQMSRIGKEVIGTTASTARMDAGVS